MNILKLFVLILTVSLITGACEYDNPQPFPEITDTISYSADIQPYFDMSCNMAGCHITGAVKPDLTAGNSYASLFAEDQIDINDPEDSKLYEKINTGGSMESYSTPSANQKVLAWIQQGALEN